MPKPPACDADMVDAALAITRMTTTRPDRHSLDIVLQGFGVDRDELRSTPIPNRYLDLRLPPGPLATLIRLIRYSPNGYESAPSIPTLARDLACSPTSTRVYLSELIARGIITAEPRAGDTTIYRLVVDTKSLPR